MVNWEVNNTCDKKTIDVSIKDIEVINKTDLKLDQLKNVLQCIADELDNELENIKKVIIVKNRKGFLVNVIK